MSTTIIQSFGGNVGIGTDTVGDSRLKVFKELSNVGALTITSLTVAGVTNSTVPVGLIIMWYDKNNIPDGWLLCDGTNGTPNLVDLFPRNIGTGQTSSGFVNNVSNANFNSIDELPIHNHTLTVVNSDTHTHTWDSNYHNNNHTHDYKWHGHSHPTMTKNTSGHGNHSHSMNSTNQNHTHSHRIYSHNHTHDQYINDTRFGVFGTNQGYNHAQTWASWTSHHNIVSSSDVPVNTNSNSNHSHSSDTKQHSHSIGQPTHPDGVNHLHTIGDGTSDHQHTLNASSSPGGNHDHQGVTSPNGDHDHQLIISPSNPSGHNTFSTLPSYKHIVFIMKAPAS